MAKKLVNLTDEELQNELKTLQEELERRKADQYQKAKDEAYSDLIVKEAQLQNLLTECESLASAYGLNFAIKMCGEQTFLMVKRGCTKIITQIIGIRLARIVKNGS